MKPRGVARPDERLCEVRYNRAMSISTETRALHRRWLFEITQIPTAAGREDRVERWIERWAAERPDVTLTRDAVGNITLARTHEPGGRPLYFTAHLDHPAFVVERVVGPGELEMSFRGGVMDAYFEQATVEVLDHENKPHLGRVAEKCGENAYGNLWRVKLGEPADGIVPGDIGRWALPPASEIDGCIHTDACDDLSAVAAALSAFDVWRGFQVANQPVRVLFTRAEEIGFVGAIAAVKEKILPRDARIIALENSRSFPESPIGGGPVVRVGDRLSVFSPCLTAAIAKRAEDLATQSVKEGKPAWKWQRKLMAGGACEASVFCEAGYEATCVCLALGNYHNMADLTAVQAKTNTEPAKIGCEFVSLEDYDGLIDLLVACAQELPEASPVTALVDKLWRERSSVLARD
jgi:putative aminopeptidase FrvX